jgi:hypothetical protein
MRKEMKEKLKKAGLAVGKFKVRGSSAGCGIRFKVQGFILEALTRLSRISLFTIHLSPSVDRQLTLTTS